MGAKPFQPTGDNCSVDGWRPKPGDRIWEGLDWSRAEWRGQSTLMLALVGPEAAPADWHWRVPFPEEESWHRVRRERRRVKALFADRTPPLVPVPACPPEIRTVEEARAVYRAVLDIAKESTP